MSMHVLVTGAAGYLGSVLCEHLLDAGYQVTALDNLMYGQNSLFHLCANPNFEFIFGDARNPELIQGVLPVHQVV
ncbi:MAG: NAD-dependent epimerase/dehydratase family protein [Cyanobacteria bacterium J06638_6]